MNSEWSDMPSNYVNWCSVIKSTSLVIYFVSVFQSIDFMSKIVCYVQYTIFYLYVSIIASTIAWHTSDTIWLIVCLGIFEGYWKRVYESPVAKNRNVTAHVSWTKIAARNLICLFTIFGPTKLIRSLKSACTIAVHFLCLTLIAWHFKSANKLVPLYTDLFLYNSVYHQCLSRRVFWTTCNVHI
jgi:hypothetical protein